MIQSLIDLLAFALFAFPAWYFLYYVVPVAGTQIALYMLHNRRDEIYNIIEKGGEREASLIYQDMLWGITALIHILREKPRAYSVLTSFYVLIARSEKKDLRDADLDWRYRRYEHEIATLFSESRKKEELDAAIGAFRKKNNALLLFVLLSHPLVFLLAVFASIISMLVLPAYLLYRIYSQSGVIMIEKTIESLRKSELSESQPFKWQLNP